MPTPQEFILTLSCPDAKGIVYAVSGLLYSAGCNILDSQQFGDVQTPENHGTGLFFMRVHFEAPPHLADTAMLDRTLAAGPWDAVFHFAALSLVGESMREPMRYLLDNAAVGMRLIDGCIRHGVPRFVLSSTANLFGEPDSVPIDESAPLRPSSPYGESKLMIEQALRWADRLHGLRSASLRYFNAAGADPDGRGHLAPDRRLRRDEARRGGRGARRPSPRLRRRDPGPRPARDGGADHRGARAVARGDPVRAPRRHPSREGLTPCSASSASP